MSDSADSNPLPSLPIAYISRTCCHSCFKTNSKFRCTGCQAVVYCSRECQKAAWRTHKPACTSKPNTNFELQESDLGYPSPLSFFHALSEWMELRRWCLSTLTCALVQLEGGVDAVLATQKVLVFHIVPFHRTEHDGDPAMAFRFDHAVFIHGDSDDFLHEKMAEIRANIPAATNLSSTPFPDPLAFLDPERKDRLASPVGSLPILYVVCRTSMVSGQVFTLFRLPLRHVDSEDPADERTRAALEDLATMMMAALCLQILYRHAENPQQLEPDWGHFERTGRRGKTWKWTPLPASEEMWRRREKVLDQMTRPGSTSDLTPRQLLTLFDYGHLGTKWWCDRQHEVDQECVTYEEHL
ncbi:hypothetical protein LXA43DRAFT_1068247 [Ganoderma leucocontextum]|nr:hypothetical protein LXA43DRAFT_1068247 [Ganoderma leucocontextum]